MRKLAIVFVLLVFAPSLILAWLVVRSLHTQQFVLERQQSLLYQKVADSIASDVNTFLLGREYEFVQMVEGMLSTNSDAVAADFNNQLRTNWPYAQVGFVVTLKGKILSPSPASCPTFFSENGRFVCSVAPSEVYLNVYNATKNGSMQQQAVATKNDIGQQAAFKAQKRSVVPQQNLAPQVTIEDVTDSKVAPSEAEFRQIIGGRTQGTLARFVDNKLSVLTWYRPPRRSDLVFGSQLSMPTLINSIKDYVHDVDPNLRNEICVALLDDAARPVAASKPDFRGTWRHPFVATEIGEALPHWEAAVYLLNPSQLEKTAATARLFLGLIVTALVLAIGAGSWLIVQALRKELLLARQKTDFVSNVSHELKTPLTSIRMFSELLAEGRVREAEKQRSYLQIISAEAGRLTRLINNVLDFARLERGEQKFQFSQCDITAIVRDCCDMYRPHLVENGYEFNCHVDAAPILVRGDRDALAQVLVNLLSNAEKYSGPQKQITLEIKERADVPSNVDITVSDRGIGVSRGCEERIFEQFYRADDSLNSGIQGSGLGLTLARQIARAHGGDVTYAPREGGGSRFILTLPVRNT